MEGGCWSGRLRTVLVPFLKVPDGQAMDVNVPDEGMDVSEDPGGSCQAYSGGVKRSRSVVYLPTAL
jgi:hypothetical protein